MKAVFVLFASLLFVSCLKRDWNCSCTVNGTDITKTIKKTTKSKAKTTCSDYGKSVGQSYSSGTYTYKCEVK